jgi:adenosylcobyric acid synthase
LLSLDGMPEGACAGRVAGSYVHGLFASDAYRAQWLAGLRAGRSAGISYDAQVEATLDRLAEHIGAAVDLDRLLGLARCV